MSFNMGQRDKKRCEECHGDKVVVRYSRIMFRWHQVPCPSCGATGIELSSDPTDNSGDNTGSPKENGASPLLTAAPLSHDTEGRAS